MKSTILTVGTEILFGSVVNTNAAYLSEQLQLLGMDVMYHHTVGDNDKRLKSVIELSLKDCDLLITTGGLGPTEDDLTKETIAAFFGDTLEFHEPSFDAMRERMERNGRKMTPNNRKQAYLPSRATPFLNACGTAPGFALEKDGKIVMCFPGPPHELKDMWERSALPYLAKYADGVIFHKMIRTFGIGESALETKLLELIDAQTDPTIATYAKPGLADVRVASKRKTRKEAEEAVDAMIERIRALVGEYVYAENGEEIYEVLAKRLIGEGITLSVAESMTGGLFAGKITSYSGVSAVFDRGIVTYTNRAKIDELGVSKETLERFDAVSEEVAREMVEGLSKKTGSDLCLSVTGYAGPGGGTEEAPVGTAFIGCVYKGRTTVFRLEPGPNDDREWNRNRALLYMANVALRTLDGRM